MKIDKNKYTGINRLEIFSDGVFSIAITLLVLELIQMLHLKREEDLLKTFWHNWELFLAFFIGFVTILICWINHTHALKHINKVDEFLVEARRQRVAGPAVPTSIGAG